MNRFFTTGVHHAQPARLHRAPAAAGLRVPGLRHTACFALSHHVLSRARRSALQARRFLLTLRP